MRFDISRLLGRAGHVKHQARHDARRPGTVGAGFEALERRALMATFSVTNLNDAGAGSLRQAIADSNGAAGADVIEFDPSVTGTISLSSGELAVTEDLSILGPGADRLSVSGSDLSRVFNFVSGSSSLSGISLIDGNAEFGGHGGGILNSGTLTVTNSSMAGNVANRNGAGGGGGVANSGTMTIISSTISGGATGTDGGGGVLNFGSMSIRDSTISGNSTATPAGGGGIKNQGAMTIANSTIAGNSSGSVGGITNGGVLTITNSTISGNHAYSTGGISSAGSLQLISSIVAGNSRYDTTPADIAATLDAGSTNNLIGDAASAGGLTNGVNGNLVGIDPNLGALASNGGPTQTMALAADSPAIGKGLNPNNLTTDQRGGLFARGTAVDIGAYQRQTLNLVVDTLVDEDDGNYGSGDLSLREAVAAAGPNPGFDTITFASVLDDGTITLGGTPIAITGDLLIDGPGADTLTVTGANASRVFDASANANAQIADLTIAAGGIVNAGNLVVSGSVLSATSFNFVDEGGALYNTGTFYLRRSTVQDNHAWYGAGLANHGVLTVEDSTVANNSLIGNGSGGGGGILSNGTLYLTNSTVTGNQSAVGGAGLQLYGGEAYIYNSTIAGNSYDQISTYGATTLLHSSIVAGGSFCIGGTVTGSNNLVESAASAGGLTNGVNGNVIGADPMLGALADNGGPTQTMALAADSPAIGVGSNLLALLTDQRGGLFARGSAVDIGAYQRQTLNLVVDTLVDEDDGEYAAGDLALREAIRFANDNPGTDAISFSVALNGGTITLGGSQLIISDGVTITGPGAKLLAISANNQSRVLYFTVGTSSLSGLKITGGNGDVPASGVIQGGGIRNEAILTLHEVWITGNAVPGGGENGGGGISNAAGGSLTVTSSTISNNAGGYWGGGILNTGGATLTITNSTIASNQATFAASAIQCSGATTIQNCTISGNSTTDSDAIAPAVSVGSTTTMVSSIVAGNTTGGGTPGDIQGTLLGTSSNNLIASVAYAGGLTNGVNGNLVGVDPKLGVLADNGGLTPTMALAADSPAINKGLNPANLTTDQRGTGFTRVRGAAIDIGAYEARLAPTIAGLQVGTGSTFSIEKAARKSTVVLYPGAQADADGTATATNFYRDLDADGIADVAELIGSTTHEFSLAYEIPADAPLGGMAFLAVAVDNDGQESAPASASVTIVPAAPTIGSLTLSSLLVHRGDSVVFTAHDPAGGETGVQLVRVEFYRRVTTQGGYGDTKVGEDTTPSDGWTYTLDTAGMAAGFPAFIGPGGYNGIVSYYAVAVDTYGTVSTLAFAEEFQSLQILDRPLAGASAGSTGNVNIVTGDSISSPVIYQQQSGSTTWTKSDLKAKTNCPDITGEVVSWVDPKDGRNYAAAMSALGLLLFTNTTGANWIFRNLSTEIPGTPAITGNLTAFTSIDGLVSIAGAAANGDLIRYAQTGAGDSGLYAWTAHNHGDDLRAQGLTVPQFTGRITSFVTPWNALNVVGLDANGAIRAIWWHQSLATDGKWTTNNLSDDTGAPPLSGGLTVWITSWNAINIAGTDSSGKISATWWVPGYNDGHWNNNNLTDDIGGPIFEASSVTSWVTPWGAMNIAGREADGTIGVYWWVPNYNNNLWNIEHFRDVVPDAVPTIGPVSGVTALGGDSSMSILGSSSQGDVLRLWWSPTTNTWAQENLTQVAVPA